MIVRDYHEKFKQESNPYKKKLNFIAQLSHYQQIASIPEQTKNFIYTIINQQNSNQNLVINKIKKKQRYHSNKIGSDYKKKLSKLNKKIFYTIDQLLKNQDSHQFKQELILPPIKRKNKPNINGQHLNANTSKTRQKVSNSQQLPAQNLKKYITIDTRLQTEEKSIDQGQIKLYVHNYKGNRNQCTPKQIDHQKPKKNYINVSRQQMNDSQSEMEYEKDASPGPGEYLTCIPSFINNTKNVSKFSFGSKSSRFTKINVIRKKQIQKFEDEQKKQPKNKKNQKYKKCVPFNSLSSKKPKIDKNESPGPSDYNLRQGIQQELIHKIQRNFKGNFGVYEHRFKDKPKYGPQIGPGRYDFSKIVPQQSNIHRSYFFLSNSNRF